ncbi:MAG: hypothetical protein ACWGOX_14230 [Desulforhopalus sp.]
MQKIIDELKQLITFKETTDIGDIVLIIAKEPQMLMYARVCGIKRDPSRRDEWWHVHLTMLTVPLQEIVWTLRTAQFTGQEIFTMGGAERFIKAIDFNSVKDLSQQQSTPGNKKKSGGLKRIK